MFAWFVPSTRIFLAKAAYIVLGSSLQVQLFACKLNT